MIPCRECRGDQTLEVVVRGHPSDPAAEVATVDCDHCCALGVEPCVGCGDPGTLAGRDGFVLPGSGGRMVPRVYCGMACAEADDNAPFAVEATL